MKEVMEEAVLLFLLLVIYTPDAQGTRYSPPGKPELTRCRSPEKETFTCWWKPGSDGGLPTTHALYYRKENSDTIYECSDYHTAGENSCFFNKNDTSIWVNYNITVVASNALGSTFSDPVDIDVVYIVKPNPPEKVTVTVMELKEWPFLRVSWEPPHKADTRSGWITLIYELRVKLEGDDEWEMHLAGQQKLFNIFSLRSGGTYHVQVRCKPDHGFWSEWSSTSHIEIPDYLHREKSMWILIAVFSAFIFLILTWSLHMSSHSLKHCILPPVPGPKIKGFDKQLLKNGKSEDLLRVLVVSDFPPTTPSNYEDMLVEYLEVYVPQEQEVLLEESKDLHDSCLKFEGSTSDNDSGRVSCDSHTLLMDKCGEAKEEGRQTDQEDSTTEAEAQGQQKDWDQDTLMYANGDILSPEKSSGRVKTWPSVFSPLPQYTLSLPDQTSSLEMAKQHCYSDSLFCPGSTSSYLTHLGNNDNETLGPGSWEICLSNRQPYSHIPQMQTCQQVRSHSDVNISTIARKQEPAGLPLPFFRPTAYVEVQRFDEEDMVVLQSIVSDHGFHEGFPQMLQQEDYSKVKGVDSNNMLLLQTEAMKEDGDGCRCQDQVTNGVTESSCTLSISTTPHKPTAHIHTVVSTQDEMAQPASGYVDTATIFTLPTY
ncbi:prolactin receptor a [Echeneis naucrates]|uniref:prolactin receptor a n=1 Tax=Echeneis naucrates TaxID=173247 RepID=UPI0011146444|nr:prolactin receptor [Echeneis naucrates]